MFSGSRVREQVLEVIIRQALAGAPWREICAGPMMVNNITAEEVEHHVRYRQRLLAGEEIEIPPAQRELLSNYIGEWRSVAASTAPLDMKKTIEAVARFYKALGLAEPAVIYCGDPVQLACFPKVLSDKLERSHIERALTPWPAARQERFFSDLDNQLKAIDSKSATVPGEALTLRINSRVLIEAHDELHRESQRYLTGVIIAALRFDVGVNLARSFEPLRIMNNPRLYGITEAGPNPPPGINSAVLNILTAQSPEVAALAARGHAIMEPLFSERDLCGLWQCVDSIRATFAMSHLNPEPCELKSFAIASAFLDVFRHLPAAQFYERICFVCERPQSFSVDENARLHNISGPAVQYANGASLHAWRGTVIPAQAIEQRNEITIAQINAMENVEVRFALIELYGAARYLQDSGAELVHEDARGQLFRKEVPGAEPLVMVRVTNSTPESDGTYKQYFLRVPPFITTASDAVAWTFGMRGSEYNPAEES